MMANTWPRDRRLANPNAAPSSSTLARTQLLRCNTANLDLVLNDNDARCIASRHANTATGSITPHTAPAPPRLSNDRRRLAGGPRTPACRAHTLPPHTGSYSTVTGLSPSASAGL